MRQCTWVNCTNKAKYPQTGKDKIQWADLCSLHHVKFEEAMLGVDLTGVNIIEVMNAIILAQGGPDEAAKRMFVI